MDAYPAKARLGTPGFADYASLAAGAAGAAGTAGTAGAAGAKPYGLLDAEAMEEDERNAARKAALTAIATWSADSRIPAKGVAAAPAEDPNAPRDSDPVDVWMAKRRAEIARRSLARQPESTELSDDLPIEEWMKRRSITTPGGPRRRQSALVDRQYLAAARFQTTVPR